VAKTHFQMSDPFLFCEEDYESEAWDGYDEEEIDYSSDDEADGENTCSDFSVANWQATEGPQRWTPATLSELPRGLRKIVRRAIIITDAGGWDTLECDSSQLPGFLTVGPALLMHLTEVFRDEGVILRNKVIALDKDENMFPLWRGEGLTCDWHDFYWNHWFGCELPKLADRDGWYDDMSEEEIYLLSEKGYPPGREYEYFRGRRSYKERMNARITSVQNYSRKARARLRESNFQSITCNDCDGLLPKSTPAITTGRDSSPPSGLFSKNPTGLTLKDSVGAFDDGTACHDAAATEIEFDQPFAPRAPPSSRLPFSPDGPSALPTTHAQQHV
jgi:hypothetical protein